MTKKKIDEEHIVNSCILNDFGYNELIIFKNFHFKSSCAHNLMPTIGRAHVGYIPNDKLLGVGSMGEIIDTLANLPNIQERLTVQIAQKIHVTINAKATIVVLEASHYCSRLDTQRQQQSLLRSTHILGLLDEKQRSEFMRSISN